MNTKDKALAAKHILSDELLSSVFEDLKNEQIKVFISHTSKDEREQAHYIALALGMVQDRLKSYVSDEAIEDKRQPNP